MTNYVYRLRVCVCVCKRRPGVQRCHGTGWLRPRPHDRNAPAHTGTPFAILYKLSVVKDCAGAPARRDTHAAVGPVDLAGLIINVNDRAAAVRQRSPAFIGATDNVMSFLN